MVVLSAWCFGSDSPVALQGCCFERYVLLFFVEFIRARREGLNDFVTKLLAIPKITEQ